MRNLASIQRILSISPIEGADSIEVAKVLGWNVVIRKGEFKVGDKVVYIEVDSILPDRPEFEFLKDSRGNIRLRTVKLRGQISQGIIFPLSILPTNELFAEDDDVTEILGITKYEPVLSPQLAGTAKGLFPSFIPKSDETRVQVLQKLLDKYKGMLSYVTEKLDGSSITCYLKDGVFGVCSRNIDLKETEGNTFWKTVRKLGIEEKMREQFGDNAAIQGELIGEGIQGNKLGIKGHTIRFFNVFNIGKQEYAGFHEFVGCIEDMGLQTVPILTTTLVLDNNIDAFVEMAKGNSVFTNVKREGIVVRPLNNIIDKDIRHCQGNRISFKAINPDFLLKYKE